MVEVTHTVPTHSSHSSYVEWGSIIAGAVASLAVSAILLSFGAAAGLSAVSPWSSSTTYTAVAIGSGFWVLLVSLWSFGLGGYLAARLRHRWSDGNQDEIDFRDNAHGVLSWAVAVTFAAVVVAISSATTERSTTDAVPSSAASTFAVDSVLRSSRTDVPVASDTLRAEVGRTFTRNVARTTLPAGDKAYLAALVSARSKVEPEEANRKVLLAFEEFRKTSDQARKAGVVMGFLAAATLLVGGAMAWWAAGVGGQHRDSGTTWEAFHRAHRVKIFKP
ncbi:MAG: hypothetical protein AB7L90_00845 [Hyphomicrobiaceae bacterium]